MAAVAYFVQVSFYHDCGHAEELIWHSATINPTRIPRRPDGMPSVESSSTVDGAADDLQGKKFMEVHYQYTSCGNCLGTAPAGRARPNLVSRQNGIEELRRNWRIYVDQRQHIRDLQARLIHRKLTRLASAKGQLERQLQAPSSAEMAHGQVSQEILDDIDVIDREITRTHARASTIRHVVSTIAREAQEHVPLGARSHFLTQGMDIDLFAAVDPHTFQEDEVCPICLNELNTVTGRVRRLPCGHVFHGTCVRTWIETARNDTCPYCRHQYLLFLTLDI